MPRKGTATGAQGKADSLLRAGGAGASPSFATGGGPWCARTGLLCRLSAPKRERSRRAARPVPSLPLFMGGGASATHARLLSCWESQAEGVDQAAERGETSLDRLRVWEWDKGKPGQE